MPGARPAAFTLAVALGTGAALAQAPAPGGDGLVASRPIPEAWRRVAVLAVLAGPEHRRPAAEVVALALRAQPRLVVVPPFQAERMLADRSGAAEAGPVHDVFAATPAALLEADPPAEALGADDARALAAALGVDGVVIGRAVRTTFGVTVTLTLHDGADGMARVAVRATAGHRRDLADAVLAATRDAADLLARALGAPAPPSPRAPEDP